MTTSEPETVVVQTAEGGHRRLPQGASPAPGETVVSLETLTEDETRQLQIDLTHQASQEQRRVHATPHVYETGPDAFAECALLVQAVTPVPERGLVEAAIVVRSCGQAESLYEGIRAAQLFGVQTLIYGGHNEAEHARSGDVDLRVYQKTFRHIFVEQHAANTRDLSKNCAETLRRHGVRECVLIATGWHLTRAYLTFVATLQRRGMTVKLLPFPVAGTARIEPASDAHKQSGYHTLAGAIRAELERCQTYVRTGDLAGLRQLQEYLNSVRITKP